MHRKTRACEHVRNTPSPLCSITSTCTVSLIKVSAPCSHHPCDSVHIPGTCTCETECNDAIEVHAFSHAMQDARPLRCIGCRSKLLQISGEGLTSQSIERAHSQDSQNILVHKILRPCDDAATLKMKGAHGLTSQSL